MLTGATLILMLIVAVAFWRMGVFNALCMFVGVLLAGILAFNFWEPLADLLQPSAKDTQIAGFEDFICLIGVFCVLLIVFRVVINLLNTHAMEYNPALLNGGGALLGLITGYLLSGFLVCAMQTLPWHENFLGFQARQKDETAMRNFMPPDRAWLSVVHSAGIGVFSRRLYPEPEEEGSSPYNIFDRQENFEERYRLLRRYGDNRPAGTVLEKKQKS